jgi:hypothetical protein
MKKKRSNKYFLVAGMATASAISGCDKSTKQWADSPGTNGFMNLDAVKEAFQKNPAVEDFEKRVNEIFEGDNLIIFSSEERSGGFTYTAKEDLDGDKKIGPSDETLFVLSVSGRIATLEGAGVNKYYKESWIYNTPGQKPEREYSRSHYSRPHFHYWYWGRRWGGYYTPAPRYDTMSDHRNSYRNSSAFVSQVNNNVAFEQRMAARYGSGFRKSVNAVSTTRKNHISNMKKSSGFKGMLSRTKSTSGWGARSRSSGSRGGFGSVRGSSRGGSRGGFGGGRGSSGFGV